MPKIVEGRTRRYFRMSNLLQNIKQIQWETLKAFKKLLKSLTKPKQQAGKNFDLVKCDLQTLLLLRPQKIRITICAKWL